MAASATNNLDPDAFDRSAAAGTLSDAEYERLSNLAADADEKRWATEAGGAA